MECFYINIQAHIAKKQGDLEKAKRRAFIAIILDFLALIFLYVGLCISFYIFVRVFVVGSGDSDGDN